MLKNDLGDAVGGLWGSFPSLLEVETKNVLEWGGVVVCNIVWGSRGMVESVMGGGW